MAVTRDQVRRQMNGDEVPVGGGPSARPVIRQEELNERERILNERIALINQRERDFEARILEQPAPAAQTAGVQRVRNGGDANVHSECKYTIKLPKFCDNDPDLWFLQIESIFSRMGISTEEARSQIVMSQLDADRLNCIRQLIMTIPRPADIYSQMKRSLISHYTIPDETRVFKVIRGDVVNEGKPSEILSQLRRLDAGNCNDKVLRAIFLSKLPHQHQLLLSANTTATLQEIAMQADRLAEVDKAVSTSNPVASVVSQTTPEENKVESLAAEVALLKTKLEETNNRRSRETQRRDYGNSNFRGRGRPFNRGYNNNYRGRGRGRGFYRSNSFNRNYNFRGNQSRGNPYFNRFRSQSPHHRNCHNNNYNQHQSSEQCHSESRNSCCNQGQSEN